MSEDTRYMQLADELEAQIRQGLYAPGQKIPSVRRLCGQFGVSLSTVLSACRVLENRGLIHARPQSGHYVKASAGARLPEATFDRPPEGSRRIDLSLAVRLNAEIAGRTDQATLGTAVQSTDLMPMKTLSRLMAQQMRFHPRLCHGYDAPPGSLALRRAIARRGPDSGYSVHPDDIVITNGAKEAVYLSIRSVTRPGQTVAVESPTYYGVLEVLASLDLNVVEVASDARHGLCLDHLEQVFGRHEVAALVLVSNFANPTGSCMNEENKQRLVNILERHRVPLVEDDVYGELTYEGPRPRAIKAYDRGGNVLYCSSFSKTLSPGLRVGWAIPGRCQGRLERLKLGVNQATAVAPQLALAAYLESGGYDRHLRRLRGQFREQMHRLLKAVAEYFPPGTRATPPAGGHVLWVQLPEGVEALRLYESAQQAGISLAPGPMFSASGGCGQFVRLNAGFPWSDVMERAVRTLGEQAARLVADRA